VAFYQLHCTNNDVGLIIHFFLAQCIDKYIALREQDDQSEDVDPRLQSIVERMFQRCIDDGEYKQAIGIALESKRLDVVEDVISKGNPHELLSFVIEVSMTLVQNLQFRNEVGSNTLMIWLAGMRLK
jgi:26S proteasome regulatory subunit N2